MDSLRIDSSIGAHFPISLMTILHLKVRKVCGSVLLITEFCLSTEHGFLHTLTILPTLETIHALTSSCFIHSSAIAILLPRATSRPNFFLVGVKTKDFGFEYS